MFLKKNMSKSVPLILLFGFAFISSAQSTVTCGNQSTLPKNDIKQVTFVPNNETEGRYILEWCMVNNFSNFELWDMSLKYSQKVSKEDCMSFKKYKLPGELPHSHYEENIGLNCSEVS